MSRLIWMWQAPDGSSVILGEYEYRGGGEGAIVDVATDRELARSWARELRAGRIPPDEPDPEPAADESLADQTLAEPE